MSARELVSIEALGAAQVTLIDDAEHGKIAVGMSDGAPFATSNRCRHLGGQLGKGEVASDGMLECPLHGARFDVRSGKMTRGPQGAFKPLAGVVRGTAGRMALKTYPVEVRDGAIWLTS